MIILCWLKFPSSVPKIAPIERLLLRISKQMRTISAQPNSNQTYSEFSQETCSILEWVFLFLQLSINPQKMSKAWQSVDGFPGEPVGDDAPYGGWFFTLLVAKTAAKFKSVALFIDNQ